MAMEFSYNDVLEHVELNNMLLAAKGWGVLSGLAVSERGAGANMSVDVASGSCFVDDTKYTESSTTNVVISAAHATLARKDIITYDTSAGNPAAVTGTAASTPVPPDIPSGDILLALVNVPAADTAITNSQIIDKIILVSPAGYIVDGTQVYNTTSPTTWTDLDLSSYVGTRRVVVFLRVNAGGTLLLGFRENGISLSNYFFNTDQCGASFIQMYSGTGGYAIVQTDTSGIIELEGSATVDCDVWLEGYWITR